MCHCNGNCTRALTFENFCQARTNLIIDAEEAGGKIQPAWFGTSGYTDFASPSGYLVRIETSKDKTVAYPVQGVTIQSEDVSKTAKVCVCVCVCVCLYKSVP